MAVYDTGLCPLQIFRFDYCMVQKLDLPALNPEVCKQTLKLACITTKALILNLAFDDKHSRPSQSHSYHQPAIHMLLDLHAQRHPCITVGLTRASLDPQQKSGTCAKRGRQRRLPCCMRAPTPNQKLLSRVKLFSTTSESGLHGWGLYHSQGLNLWQSTQNTHTQKFQNICSK